MSDLLSQDFNTIDAFYKKLNSDISHFENSNDICTPLGCVKEMVDTIPASFWRRKNIRVLDSCCGNGNFHAYIQKKTRLANLYFNETNSKRIENVINIFGKDINLTKKDFLSFPDREQFDLVVSNPPYAKFNNGKRVSKNHNTSRDFIRKAINITKPDGYILFIAPDNWMSYSDRNILPSMMSQYQFIHLNIHGAKKWFRQVGSSFTWFLMKKSINKDSFKIENNYIKRNVEQARLEKNVPFIPLYYSDTVREIFNKTVMSNQPKYKVETTSYLHRYTKRNIINNQRSGKHIYRLIHTPNQTVWSEKAHKYQVGWKVFISLTDRYRLFIDDCGMTQSVAFIRCRSKSEAERVKKELEYPLYKFINNLTRYGNFNNIRVLQNLPVWRKVSLTTKERAYIEQFA